MPFNGRDTDSVASAMRWEARIVAAREGDRDALGEILQALRAHLQSSACADLDGRIQIKNSPSDIAQDALLEACRGFAGFQGITRTDLVVWVQGILKHRLQAAYRKYRGTGKRNIARETALQVVDDSGYGQLLAASKDRSPSGQAIENEEQARLEQALKALPPRYEQVIRLRHELNFSFNEVAVALCCSPDAAQKLWTRAIRQLARELHFDAAPHG